jgi:SOS response regulatory protein OraA/RecX
VYGEGTKVAMIDDSYVWKNRLRTGRAILRRKLRRAKVDPARVDAAFVEIEAFAFLTGYIIRKLLEAKKLSDELEAAIMNVVTYPAAPSTRSTSSARTRSSAGMT